MPDHKLIRLKPEIHWSESEGQNCHINKLGLSDGCNYYRSPTFVITSRLDKEESLSITDCRSRYTEVVHRHVQSLSLAA